MNRKVPFVLRFLPVACIIASIGILGTLVWYLDTIERATESFLMEAHAPELEKQASLLLQSLREDGGTLTVAGRMVEGTHASPASGRYWQASADNWVSPRRSPSLGSDTLPEGGFGIGLGEVLATIFTFPFSALSPESSQKETYLATARFADSRVERLLVLTLTTKVTVRGQEPHVFKVRIAENTAPFMAPILRSRTIILTVTGTLLAALFALSVLALVRTRKEMRRAPEPIDEKT